MRVRALSPVLLAVLVVAPATDATAAKKRKPVLPSVTKVAPAPVQLVRGERLAYAVTVKNRGRSTTKRASIVLRLSRDAKRSKDDLVLGKLVLKPLKRGKTQRGRIRVTVPASAKVGRYRLLTCSGTACKVAKGTVRLIVKAPTGGVQGTAAPVADAATAGATAPSEQAAPPPPPAAQPGNGTPDPGNGGGNQPDPIDPPPTDPLDPPKPDPGVATSMAETTKFLYEGKDAPQQGVAPGTIKPERVAVTRGTVKSTAGAALGGVEVTVLGHPEYGKTHTRADGGFDMALNGATVDLVFRKAGFPDVQRQVSAPWRDYDVVDDVVMTPYDTKVSTVDLDSDRAFQAVVGTPSVAGQPAPVLLFPKGVNASLDLAGKRRVETSDELKVRATEFPRTGDATLPGTMPGNVGLTYAAEFSVDEAISQGATSVDFDKPVINLTTNTTGAPVGTPVPTAYYNRDEGRWIPQPNGRVIAVVSEAGDLATVDVDGDGAADTGAALTALGITDAELRELARLYEPGRQLWRVLVRHFTPWDHNWPWGPPPDAKPPKLKEFEWKDPNDPCNKQGSIISCETQVLGEQVPVAGTPYKLTWSSQRAKGYKVGEQLTLPVTGGAIPDRLKGVVLNVEIAGKKIEQRWCDPNYPTTSAEICRGLPPIKANTTYDLTWDGKDAYGNPVQGKPVATVGVTYVYEFEYYPSSDDFEKSFGQFPEDTQTFNGAPYCGNQLAGMDNETIRQTHFFCGILARQTTKRTIGSWDATPVDGLGGLSLDVHHGYDPNERVVHRGDATVLRSETLGMQTRTIVGGGRNVGPEPTPSTQTNIDYLSDSTVLADGRVCGYSGLNQSYIWCQQPDGTVKAIAGKDQPDAFGAITTAPQPALGAVLGREIGGIAAGPDGSIYFTTYAGGGWAGYVRKVSPDGTLTTIAGYDYSKDSPQKPGNGDGGPATQAKIHYRGPIEVGPDGSVYFAEPSGGTNDFAAVVRRISPDGTISTVAGGGSDATQTEDLGDGELATKHSFGRIDGIEVLDDGTIYLADSRDHVVQRIGPDGRVQRVVGDGTFGMTYGDRGAEAKIGAPTAIAHAADGTMYVRTNYNGDSGSDQKILRVDETGLVTRFAGRASQPLCRYCASQDGEQATATLIEGHSNGLDVLGDGTVVYSDGRYQVRRIDPALPGFGDGANVVPEPDGSVVHLFDVKGRHQRTVDGLTGVTKVQFAYDDDNRMTSVTDGDGNVTKIERDGNGTPKALVAPGGQRTELELDGEGRVHVVKAPGARQWTFGYGAGSLLSEFTAPGGLKSRFVYDADGRLVEDHAPDGSVQRLRREESLERTVVTHTSGAGKETTYVVEVEDDGDRVRRVIEPSGAETKVELTPDGTQRTTAADGTVSEVETEPDPRWGTRVAVPSKTTMRTPKGKRQEVTSKRTVELADPLNVLSVRKAATTTSVENDPATSADDQNSTFEYDATTRTITQRSEGRRSSRSKLDERGRVVEFDGDAGGSAVDPITYAYGAGGRVSSIVQGTQRWTFTYDERGRTKTRTDAAGDTLTFGYDDGDRIVSETYPGDRTWRYEYQADGALKALVSPEGRRHAFGSDARGRTRTYDPPGAAGPYTRRYDADGRLDDVTLPSGAVRDVAFDARGRETTTNHAGGTADALAYSGLGDNPASMTRTNGAVTQGIAEVLDGGLPVKTTQSGAARGTFDYAIGEHTLQVDEIALTSGEDRVKIPFGYDADGLVRKIGPFTLTREGATGAVSAMGDGTLAAAYGQDKALGFAKRALTVGGKAVYEARVTRDPQGRVQTRTTKVGAAAARTLTYDYDEVGELGSVKEGAIVREAHTYDKDGNRTTDGAQYDAEGRLTSLGGKAWVTDADGFVTKRGSDTFTYARSGDLLKAEVGGTSVEYAYDAMGRRVARTEDGVTEQYLYGNPVNPFQLTASRGRDGVLTTWFYDPEGAVIAFERGGVRSYVGADQVGTPEAVFDGTGKLLRAIERDAFGRVLRDTGGEAAVPLALGFAGGLADPVTGLVRFGVRDYDPAAGRFLARDPSLFEGSPKNLYAYVGSDPVSMTDPTGLACGGASLLMGAGIGLQYCRKDGKQSFCVEAGVGVGGGIEVDPWGDPAESGPTSVIGEVSGKWGPVGLSLGFESDLDCFNTKGTAKVGTALGVAYGVDTTGSSSWSYGGDDANSVNGKGIRKPADKGGGYGGKVEGKLTLKRCIGY